jgi:hypothetical protein
MGKETAIRQPFYPSGIHSLLVTDIVGYGNRMGHMQKHVRKSLYDVLGAALRAAGVALSDCYVEDRGDGTTRPRVRTPVSASGWSCTRGGSSGTSTDWWAPN